MPDPFVSLIFRGARFGAAEMPVEALPEIVAYRDLVVAVARDMYLAAHADRQKVPKGFEASFGLRMTGVTEGSTKPTLQRVRHDRLGLSADAARQAELFGTPDDYFDSARDLVEEVIAAASAGKPLPDAFKRATLVRFNAFGRTLDDDDEIVVAKANTTTGAHYNKAVRGKLLLQTEGTHTEAVEVIGLFRMADLDTNGFALRTPDGDKIPVLCPPVFVNVAKASFHEEADVRVRGLGVYNVEGKLLRITDAIDVRLADDDDAVASAACEVPIGDQLASLRKLSDGWLDGSGTAYDADALDWVQGLLTGLTTGLQLATPFVYPTPEGQISVEWASRRWDIAVTLDVATRSAEALAVSTADSNAFLEIAVQLDRPGAEASLGGFIAERLGRK
jgi:hypothetical protein